VTPTCRRACTIAVALTTTTTTAAAAPPASPGPAPPVLPAAPATPEPPPATTVPPADDPTLRARAAYAEGQVLFDLADYEGAIARWTEAYLLLTQPRQQLRLMYTLAETHYRAHEVTRDAAHLRRARHLFAQFLGGVRTHSEGRASLSTDFANATVRLEQIDRALAQLGREAEEQRATLRMLALGAAHIEPSPPVRTMRATGVALTAAGGVGLVLMTTGMILGARATDEVGLAGLAEDERALLLTRGYRSNALAIASGVLGGAMLAAGVPLLIVARRRARAERDGAVHRLLPALAPTTFGVAWEGRF
jgi:hypothetical protein